MVRILHESQQSQRSPFYCPILQDESGTQALERFPVMETETGHAAEADFSAIRSDNARKSPGSAPLPAAKHPAPIPDDFAAIPVLNFSDHNHGFTVHFTEFRMCRHLAIVIDSSDAIVQFRSDAEYVSSGIVIDVIATIYSMNGGGQSCEAVEAVGCTPYRRQLPVVFSDRFDDLTATFVPDPGARHYSFSIKVCITL